MDEFELLYISQISTNKYNPTSHGSNGLNTIDWNNTLALFHINICETCTFLMWCWIMNTFHSINY